MQCTLDVRQQLRRHAWRTYARRLKGERCHWQWRPRGAVSLDVDARLHLHASGQGFGDGASFMQASGTRDIGKPISI